MSIFEVFRFLDFKNSKSMSQPNMTRFFSEDSILASPTEILAAELLQKEAILFITMVVFHLTKPGG